MVSVLAQNENDSQLYEFSIIGNGIEFRINNFLVDTIYDLGIMNSVEQLKITVLNLLKCWNVNLNCAMHKLK